MRKMLKLYETSNLRTLYDMLKINMKASLDDDDFELDYHHQIQE